MAFRYSNPPVDQVWLRHKNGNGRIYGNDAEISLDSYLDKESSIGDKAQCFNGAIIRSVLADNVSVAGYPNPIKIADCELSGNTRLWQCPSLREVSLRDVSVYGNARLIGPWSLSERVRIHQGEWLKPPRYQVIEGNGIRTVISECANNCFHIGCWALPYNVWTRPKYRQRIGAVAGWTPAQVEETYQWFTRWREPRIV